MPQESRTRPFARRQAKRVFVRIPRVDWLKVAGGGKTEIRNYVQPGRPRAYVYRAPCPILAYSFNRSARVYDYDLMVLEDVWEEPLGAITAESLEHEGYETVADFKAYFLARYRGGRKGWRPLDPVIVYRLRRWRPEDRREQADLLFDRLYGEILDAS